MLCFNPLDVQTWTGGKWRESLPLEITGICHDSRAVTPGVMYIAIKGDRFDGHDYIPDAFQKGAVAAMVQSDYEGSSTDSCPLLCVKDTCQGLRDFAQGYRNTLNAQMVVVTGSVGKTTVKEMLADVLATQGGCARTQGNWNNDIGLPLSLLSMEQDDVYGVFEVGMNHPGELDPLCALLKPRYGIVTAIGPVHMEFFGSVKDIAVEKAAALRALPEDGLAVIDRDGHWFDLLCGHASCPVVTTSMHADSPADYVLVKMQPEKGRIWIKEKATGEQVDIQLNIPGEFAVYDALLVVAMARYMQIDFNAIQQVLNAFQPVGMRWETSLINGTTVINDAYNANPLSMQAALQTADAIGTFGQKWVVLGGMFELGEREHDAHITLGRQVADGHWSGLIAVGGLGALIAQGAQEKGYNADTIYCCETAEDAGHILKSKMQPKDMVLLKASRSVHLEDALRIWQENN